jgi:hypothetical protein
MPTLDKNHRPRVTCSQTCATEITRQRAAERRAALVEDIEWLHECGTPAVEIARRVGRTLEALSRQMHRIGRHDLAALFNSHITAARRHPCLDCGKPVDHGATRCHPCAMLARRYQPTVLRCPRPSLAAEERAALAALRTAARHVEWAGHDTDGLIPAARAQLAKARTDLEWHDANCETCRPNHNRQEAS